jgi:hypothetical protein
LLNFGTISLQFKRLGNQKYKDTSILDNPINP